MTGMTGHRWAKALGVPLVVLLVGCAPGAPQTYTPVAPTGTIAAGGPTASDPTAANSTADPTAEALPRPDTTAGRGEKAPVEHQDLVDLGDEMTAALASGDVEQWLGLTTLTGEAAQQQRDWFAGVQAVPMDVREMHPTGVLARDVAGEVHGPLVEFSFRHQITGADPMPVVELYNFTLERVGVDGPYRIVEVTGSSDQTAAYPQLWDLGPIEVIETEHTVLLGEPDTGLSDLAKALDEGAAEVLTQFPAEGVQAMAVSVVPEALVARLFEESDEGFYAGFAWPVIASPEVTARAYQLPDLNVEDHIGARLVLDQEYAEDEWDAFDQPSGGSPVMRHEGLHLAMLMRHSMADPPRWAVEGFASWFELIGDQEVQEAHELWYPILLGDKDLPDALPPSDYYDFFAGEAEDDDESVERAYRESANVFLYAEATYGRELTLELGDALHGIDLWVDDDSDVDELLGDLLGVDLADFEAGYVEWVAQNYG